MRILALITTLLLSFPVSAQGLYTIYLVRHAEKVRDGSKDPALTECGKIRAVFLAEMLRSVKLAAIYSSDYQRTRYTAQPVADTQRLDVTLYDPTELDKIAELLTSKKHDALVVGHSDTTAVLAGLLVGEVLEEFEEGSYDRLYQVELNDRGGRVKLVQQNFQCQVAAGT